MHAHIPNTKFMVLAETSTFGIFRGRNVRGQNVQAEMSERHSTFLVIILWAVALLNPVRAAARSQVRSNILKPHEECVHILDNFSSILSKLPHNRHFYVLFKSGN